MSSPKIILRFNDTILLVVGNVLVDMFDIFYNIGVR
jgi:hypothetical protein